jgi:hypothetical protein
MRTCYLNYDLPGEYRRKRPPEKVLRPIAVHLEGSLWLVPAPLVPMEWVDWINSVPGGRSHVVLVDESEHEKIKSMARAALASAVNKYRKELEKSLAEAHERHASLDGLLASNALDEASYRKAARKADSYFLANLRECKKSLVDTEEASVLFELSGCVDDLLNGVRNAVASASAAFITYRTARKVKEDATSFPAAPPAATSAVA